MLKKVFMNWSACAFVFSRFQRLLSWQVRQVKASRAPSTAPPVKAAQKEKKKCSIL
jgi:hypothetical protein